MRRRLETINGGGGMILIRLLCVGMFVLGCEQKYGEVLAAIHIEIL